jgi:hypothetical protein
MTLRVVHSNEETTAALRMKAPFVFEAKAFLKELKRKQVEIRLSQDKN